MGLNIPHDPSNQGQDAQDDIVNLGSVAHCLPIVQEKPTDNSQSLLFFLGLVPTGEAKSEQSHRQKAYQCHP